ncbi:unnamed protein product [Rotaria sp. Silwood1]|nr:unnamed protein product [Rotaria sp. Silwood1]
MQNSKISSNHSSSGSSLASSHHDSISDNQRSKLKSPIQPEHEYADQIVTHERPLIQKSNSSNEDYIPSPSTIKKRRSTKSYRQDIYEEDLMSSDEEVNRLNKPLSVIKINDRHIREIYKLPTPPPEIKRVFHRMRSPEPKIIERIFVRRPTPEIIENIIEIPPRKVHIINREKHLRQSKPITRTKVVHLKRRHHHENEEQPQSYISSDQYLQQPPISTYTVQLKPLPMNYYQSNILPEITCNTHILQSPFYTYQSSHMPLIFSHEYTYY